MFESFSPAPSAGLSSLRHGLACRGCGRWRPSFQGNAGRSHSCRS